MCIFRLSIKVPPGMVGMKTDMAGSAAVLGAFQAIVKSNQINTPVHAILCIAENSGLTNHTTIIII